MFYRYLEWMKIYGTSHLLWYHNKGHHLYSDQNKGHTKSDSVTNRRTNDFFVLW